MQDIKRILTLGLALLLAGGLWAAPLHADEGESLEFEVDGKVPVQEFLKALSKATGKRIIWDPNDKQVRGKEIAFGFRFEGSADEIWQQSRALLTFYELVIIPVGPESRQVHLVMDARRTTSVLKLKATFVKLTDGNLKDYEFQDGLYVTTTIPVEHIQDLRSARSALARVVTGQNIGNVTEVPGTNAFVITDFAPNVVAIYRLLKAMDVPAQASTSARVTRLVTLKHARAEILVAVLSRSLPAAPGGARPAGRGAPAQPAPEPLTLSADERTNQVVVSGLAKDVDAVLETIAGLDVRITTQEPTIELLRLEHLSAMEGAGALAQLIGGSPDLWTRDANGIRRPTVVAVKSIGALILSGSPSAVQTLRRLAQEMDEAAKTE